MPLISLKTVAEQTSLSATTIRDLVREGKFPPPVRLPARRVAWSADEVSAWISERLAERTPNHKET